MKHGHGNSDDSFNEFDRAAREQIEASDRRNGVKRSKQFTPEQDTVWHAFVFTYENISNDLKYQHFKIAHEYDDGRNVAEN